MRLWEVRVRHWHPAANGKLKDGVWCDARTLIEAPDTATAHVEGFEHLMATKFFGAREDECEVMEVASVTLPYNL